MENGFRQITTSTKPVNTPDDLKGLKLRVPSAPMLSTLFTALGASPTPINFNEVYSALQTKLVEGQENPLAIIATARLYEVQKCRSLTNHVWDAYWILGNRKAVDRPPKDIQEIVFREFDKAADDERADIAALSKSLRAELQGKGLQFIEVDKKVFKAALGKTSFYKDWRAKFGDEAWALLEQNTGVLLEVLAMAQPDQPDQPATAPLANAIRFLAIDAIVRATEGHQGVPLGMAEIATALYTRHLKFLPADPTWPDRDRVVLSNGHGSMLLYALLHLTGYAQFPIEEIRRFRELGAHCEGHPEIDPASGIEVTTGPLGQGIANAFGMAVAEAYLKARASAMDSSTTTPMPSSATAACRKGWARK